MANQTEYYVDIQKLSFKMSEKCLNIRQLSQKAGISVTTIYNIFKGWKPSGTTITGVATALDLTFQELNDIFFAQEITPHVNF
ncbi:MAG: helix-turn-helix transcriptional regulator [Clostridiales bacterium]|jgi:predicted transcriptional regulator|nr:helix-turn-helix transcriptional regulator [Clostridiales bacterium]